MRPLAARRPTPARLARARSRASGEASVSHTVTPSSGSSSTRARPMAPEPVPRSATTIGARQCAGELDGDPGDDLRLGPRDQHPPIDGEIELAEAPSTEDVGERLAGAMAGQHRVEVGDHPLRGRLVEHVLDAVGAARHLADPTRRRAFTHRRRRLGEQLAPARRVAHVAPVSPHPRRAGAPARRPPARRRRRRGRRPARRPGGRS